MADGGKSFDTCFRSSKRKAGSTPPLQAYFNQQSSPRSSYGALRKTNLLQAFLPQEVSHRFMFTNKTHCLLWAVLLWDTFQPKQFDTQSPLWRRLNRSVGGYIITEPWRWGRFIILFYGILSPYNLLMFFCLFVCVPPLGLLGVISSFLFIIEKVCIIFGVSVFNFCEVGFDSPTKLVSGDPHVLWWTQP